MNKSSSEPHPGLTRDPHRGGVATTDPHPADPSLDGLALLTGDDAADLIAAALATSGGEPQRFAIDQIDHQPGIGTTVSYTTWVRWPSGTVTKEILAATTGQLPDGAARLTDGKVEVGLWRFPFDPNLPALRDACDPKQVETLIGARPSRLRLRAHRPGKRAVIEATTASGTVFLKVIRPAAAKALHERHRIAVAAGCPAPAPLAWAPEGLVALAGLSGATLRRHLGRPDAILPPADSVLAVLDTLPAQLAAQTRRRTWGQRAPHYADVLAAILPRIAARARAVAAAVDHHEPDGPDAVVHGDFYENQLMISGTRITGLLDIDTLAPGERLDDLGCLLGHLGVLAQLWPARANQINALGLSLHRRCTLEHDPAALARRAAAVVLSLATGPHRVQELNWETNTVDRVALAERWLQDNPLDVWSRT